MCISHATSCVIDDEPAPQEHVGVFRTTLPSSSTSSRARSHVAQVQPFVGISSHVMIWSFPFARRLVLDLTREVVDRVRHLVPPVAHVLRSTSAGYGDDACALGSPNCSIATAAISVLDVVGRGRTKDRRRCRLVAHPRRMAGHAVAGARIRYLLAARLYLATVAAHSGLLARTVSSVNAATIAHVA